MLLPDLKYIFHSSYSALVTAALLLAPIYSSVSFFNYWKALKDEHKQVVLYHQRHNCVVTYQMGKGLAGWPPNVSRSKPTIGKLVENLFEPLLFFIRTAEKSLDIAVMVISVQCINLELLRARKRGVKIRILLNFHHADPREEISKLMLEGIQYQFFVTHTTTLDSIFHHKYMIKDYSPDNGGYLCMGSMNFTGSSPIANYESFVFMSNHHVVESFENNFEECWHNIRMDNEGLINKTILMNARL